MNLPEIEREQILADRAEERQKHLDSLALGELYKATRGDEAEDEVEEAAQQPVPEPAAADEDNDSEAMDLVDSDEDAEGEPDNEAEDLGQRRKSFPFPDPVVAVKRTLPFQASRNRNTRTERWQR